MELVPGLFHWDSKVNKNYFNYHPDETPMEATNEMLKVLAFCEEGELQ